MSIKLRKYLTDGKKFHFTRNEGYYDTIPDETDYNYGNKKIRYTNLPYKKGTKMKIEKFHRASIAYQQNEKIGSKIKNENKLGKYKIH